MDRLLQAMSDQLGGTEEFFGARHIEERFVETQGLDVR